MVFYDRVLIIMCICFCGCMNLPGQELIIAHAQLHVDA